MLFWAAIGPYLLTLALFICLFRSSAEIAVLLVSVTLGVPLCWRFKLQGLFAAAALLAVSFLLMLFAFNTTSLWDMGLVLSLAIAMGVTYFSFEEASKLIGDLKLESTSRLDNLLELDQKFKEEIEVWKKEKEDLYKIIADKDQCIEEKEGLLTSLNELLNVLQDEVDQTYENKKTLLQEGFQKTERINHLEEDLHQAKTSIERLESLLETHKSDREKALETSLAKLQNILSEKESIVDQLEAKVAEANQSSQGALKEFETQKSSVERLKVALTEKANEIFQLKEDLLEQVEAFQNLKQKYGALENQKETVDQRLKQKEKELVDAQNNITALNSKIRSLDDALALLQTQLEGEQNQVALLENKLAQHEEEWLGKEKDLQDNLNKRQEKLEEKEQECRIIRSRLMEKDEQIKEMGHEYEKLERERQKERKNLEAAEQKLTHQDAQYEKLKLSLNEMRTKFLQLKSEAAALKESLISQETAKEKQTTLLDQVTKLLEGKKVPKEHRIVSQDLYELILNTKEFKSKYQQLREQFDEKSHLLEDTRKKLFELEGIELAQQKQTNLESHDIDPDIKELEEYLIEWQQEKQLMEEEIQSLSGLVRNLMEELNQTALKKT